MTETLQTIQYVLTKAPSLVIGLLLIGASGAVSFYLLLKLERAGDKSYREGILFPNSMWYKLWGSYRRRAAIDGWPVWPLHMPWISLLLGIVCVVIGLSR